MRVFVSLELSSDCLDRLAGWCSPLREEHRRLRWVRPELMHVTLRFFGDIGPEAVRRVIDLVEGFRPGERGILLERSGTFGRRRPSVYWLGGGFPDWTLLLAEELGRLPDGCGETATRRFVPHLTVARSGRSGRGPDSLPDPPGIEGEIDMVSVMDSRLGPEGPAYTRLGGLTLRPEGE